MSWKSLDQMVILSVLGFLSLGHLETRSLLARIDEKVTMTYAELDKTELWKSGVKNWRREVDQKINYLSFKLEIHEQEDKS